MRTTGYFFKKFACHEKVANNGLKYMSTKKRRGNLTFNASYKYGEPHSISNIPTVKFDEKLNGRTKEQLFRIYKQELMSWHHTFWLQHNEKFNKEKKDYLQKREHESTLTNGRERADDLSLFYEEFLNKNLQVHYAYQREWYKRNFILLWYGLHADIEKFLDRLATKLRRSSLNK